MLVPKLETWPKDVVEWYVQGLISKEEARGFLFEETEKKAKTEEKEPQDDGIPW